MSLKELEKELNVDYGDLIKWRDVVPTPETVSFADSEDTLRILKYMNDIIDAYGVVSVADYCDLCGTECSYIGNKYGWVNLDAAEVQNSKKNPSEFILALPKPFRIE